MRRSLILCATLLAFPAIANADEDDAPRTRMANPGMMAGGIVLTAAGATAMPVGILFSMVHSAVSCTGGPGCAVNGPDPINLFGWTVIIVSSMAIVGGVTMTILGARRVPVDVAAVGPRGTPGMTLRLTF
jgi:hypothetical protein